MATDSREHNRRLFNEINITPLTDIFLVLLIIMMVVAPMMQQFREDIHLPSVESGSPVKQGMSTLEITAQGEYFLDGQPVTKENLTSVLQNEITKHQNDAKTGASGESSAESTADSHNLAIRADKMTRSEAVIKVFEAAREAGFLKVTVAGENQEKHTQASFSEPNGQSFSNEAPAASAPLRSSDQANPMNLKLPAEEY